MADLHRQEREVLYEEQRAVYTSNHEKYSRLGKLAGGSSEAFVAARASTPIARPVALHSERLNAMPVVIGKAKLVVAVSRAPWSPLAPP